jgi:NAD(P)-dependent dehydrogenase (short-subunit alcohol dehydrogenase family)
LVTGSGRNIGRAIVLEPAGHGANVIVNARSDKAEADAVGKEAEGLGARSLVVMVDPGPHSVGTGGLRAMTKSLASGLGQYGITVNDVSPASLRPSATWIPTPR